MSVTLRHLRRQVRGILDVTPHPETDESSGELPIDTSQRSVRPTPGGLMGPRGRDTSGERVDIPAGVPAIDIPGGGHPERFTPKEDAYPFGKPPLISRVPFTAIPSPVAQSAVLVEMQAAHPVRGIIIDNWSSIYLYIPAIQLYVPPFTVRVATTTYSAPGSIRVLAEAPPGFVQPAVVANTGFSFTAYEDTITESPGIVAQGHP